MLYRCDETFYQVKKTGKNRVVLNISITKY
jgi:PleD family two-component response regulator